MLNYEIIMAGSKFPYAREDKTFAFYMNRTRATSAASERRIVGLDETLFYLSFRYIFSGFESAPPHFNPDLYKLDLTTFVWKLLNCEGTPPLPRDFHTATAIGDCMFVFGGRSGSLAAFESLP